MKSTLNSITLPLIPPNKRMHHNFFTVCIKAIENNKEGVLDKKECIKNIIKLRDEKLRQEKIGKFVKTSLFNFSPDHSRFKIKKHKIINKRRTLSQILLETQKLEIKQTLKKQISSQILDIENQNQNQLINRESNKLNDIKSNTVNYKKIKKIKASSSNPNKSIIKNKKEQTTHNLPHRYATFKKIIEYLESNNIALFELLKHNPFQNKPYQMSKGYDFLEAVKFKNYEYVREALQASSDYLFVFDYYGQTCYHWAAKLGNLKMLKILIDYGKHHNQKDFKGRTPLYLAAVNNNREVCDFLLRNKANIHLKDKYGYSASDVAGSKELKYYLGDFMTQPFSNPIYRKKVLDFLDKREENIEKKKLKKILKKIEEEHNINKEEGENEENNAD